MDYMKKLVFHDDEENDDDDGAITLEEILDALRSVS